MDTTKENYKGRAQARTERMEYNCWVGAGSGL